METRWKLEDRTVYVVEVTLALDGIWSVNWRIEELTREILGELSTEEG
jgi:hypothetical protein